MVKQLAHVCLHARDLDATEAFYRDVLGMERAFDFQREGQPYGYYLKAGQNTFIEVFKGEPGAVGNINHLAFEVDSIDATIAQAKACGVKTTDKKRGADQSWQCWLTDPNGVRIELHEYTDQSMQRVGGVAIATW